MTTKLERELQVGPGVARVFRPTTTMWTFEYTEFGKVIRTDWMRLETNFVVVVETKDWNEPRGVPLSEDERERAREALWCVASQAGARVMVESLIAFTRFVILRWKPMPHGFMANIRDHWIDYMEPGKTLTMTYSGEYPHAQLDMPSELRWTYPEGKPIDPDRWRLILTRLQNITERDLWMGHFGWKIHLPADAPPEEQP